MNKATIRQLVQDVLALAIFSVLLGCNTSVSDPALQTTTVTTPDAPPTRSSYPLSEPSPARAITLGPVPTRPKTPVPDLLTVSAFIGPDNALVALCAPDSEQHPSCEPREVSKFTLFRPQFSGAMYEYAIPDLEKVMKMGLDGSGASPTHVVVATDILSDTVRCAWRPFAMTTGQREEAIRAWLGYPENEPVPPTTTVASDFNAIVELLTPQVQDAMRANFNHFAYGGVFEQGPVLTCYADFTTTYLLGDGPPVITVAYDHLAKTRSYNLYQKAHAAGRYGTAALMTRSEYDAQDQATLNAAKQQLTDALNNRSSIIFLAPMGAHYSIAIEAWQAIAQWDLQRVGDAVNAVRYGAGPGDTDYSVPLDTMRSRITAAASSDAHAGKRIANITGLNDYYRDIGAYGNIAAPGQPEVIFTPELPPARPGVTAPANLSVRETRTAVTISWTPINSPSIVGYRVLRRIANRETDFTTLVDNALRTDTAYTDRDVKLGLTYIYRVQALGPSGSIESSKRITASPGPLPVPQNPAAVATSDAITLTWNLQDWDAIDIAAITGYRILRRVQGELEFTEVGTTNAATFTYNDQSGILPDTHYIYRIEAVADHGNSVGARATARTAPAP